MAAFQGLRLRSDGFSMDPLGEGLACYCTKPVDGTDGARERIMLATFAGYKAQSKFCVEQGIIDPDAENVIGSSDWYEARKLLTGTSHAYFDGAAIPDIQRELERRSEELVEQNWPVICSLASVLLDRPWEPVKALMSGGKWSTQVIAKYVGCAEAREILRPFGIAADCVADC